MTAKELVNAGHLSEALNVVTAGVKAEPNDPRLRITLFELLCFAGDLDEAAVQLDVLGNESVDADLAVGTYRQAIMAEKARRQFFEGGPAPQFLRSVAYATPQLRAVKLYSRGDYRDALALLEDAEEARPAVTGSLNYGETQFDDFKDGDDMLGPFLEVYYDGLYTWIPWEDLKSIRIPKPTKLRDLVWTPASVELSSGSPGSVMLPALYVDSYRQPDDEIKLGRITQWREDIQEFSVGLGQKEFLAGQDEHGILELRSIEFNPCQLPA